MAEDNLKDFTVNWMVIGLLSFCLLSFALTFIYNNNPTGLNEGTESILSDTHSTLSNQLIASDEDSETLLNITANTNPEASQLGSRDSVAVSYGARGTGVSYWTSTKTLLGWVFSGTSGKILLGFFSGVIGFFSLFYIIKFIKQGY